MSARTDRLLRLLSQVRGFLRGLQPTPFRDQLMEEITRELGWDLGADGLRVPASEPTGGA